MFITYKVTNLITNQYYIGSHKTCNENDAYMGSGILIKQSIDKFGINNHVKEVLGCFSSRQESLDLEHALIKQAKTVQDPLILNQNSGGYSFDYINNNLKFDRVSFGKKASHEHMHKAKLTNEENYNQNPCLCKHCNKPIPYDKRFNIFCNSSCAASYNNVRKTRKNKIVKKCQFCNTIFETDRVSAKFCSNKCSAEYRKTHRHNTALQQQLLNDKHTIVDRHKTESYRQISKSYNCSASTIKDLCLGRMG